VTVVMVTADAGDWTHAGRWSTIPLCKQRWH